MKYVKPIDPVTTWHLLQDNPENAAFYASSLIKSTKPENFKEHYWFPTPEDPGDPQHHTPIQKRILSELINLQELEKLNPQDNPESIETTKTTTIRPSPVSRNQCKRAPFSFFYFLNVSYKTGED